jgi:putative ABC transport system permease protein
LVVAIIPIFAGTRITVQAALSTYGLGGAAGLVDQFLVKTEVVPRMVAQVVSNTFRNKSRVVVTQLTLAGSGLVFMMVMHTQASLVYTYGEVIFATFKANVFLDLEETARIEDIEEIALAHPEVTAVETWSFASGALRSADRPESNDDPQADIRGMPEPTLTYVPQMRAGRWLEPGDTYTMVLNQELAEKIGVGVGDWVALKRPGQRESRWKVVGLLFEVFNEDAAHVPRDTLLKETGEVGLARYIRLQTRRQDAAGEAAIAAELRQFYEANGYKVQVNEEETAHQITEAILGGGISIVINLLAAMAVVIALVGAVALSGVLSINILERRREIGVMRAIGASSFHIFRLVTGEGLLLGWLSWLIALPLSLPAGWLLTSALSSIMGEELSYDYSPQGMLYWLGIVTILSILASLLPARGAMRMSVRESLAYQ